MPIVEKTSAWTDAEREKEAQTAEVVLRPSGGEERIIERPDLPPWAADLNPATPFVANGWHCEIRHVGYEGGRWMLLVEPVRPAGVFKSKARKRAEYKAAVRTVGKKEARKRARTRTP